MKKLFTLALVALLALGCLAFAGCGGVDMETKREVEGYVYHLQGDQPTWQNKLATTKLEAVALNDSRLTEAVVSALGDPAGVYVIEFTYEADSGLAVKVCEYDPEGAVSWIPSTEIQGVGNLTEATLEIDTEEDANNNPVLKEAGTYYIVLGVYGKGPHTFKLGAIKKA